MATFSDSGRITDTRSGGKIVTRRRRIPTTPYDRPQGHPQLQPRSPNWFKDVIFPATRRIASGAAKFLSLVFDSDSSDCSSSASSSYTEAAHADNDYEQLDDFSDPQKDHGAPSETMEYINEVHQLSPQKSEKTHAIEKILKKESFSREECDRLTQIINSRVVDSTVGGAEAGLTTDNDDIFSKAITEARKWLKEKKVVLSPLSDGADVSCGLESIANQQTDNEAASPVDVAKTYMRSRPPWASPFAENIELQTPSTLKSQLSRKGTLFPADDQYPSSKKKTSLASGSWNIQEEIRRVRQKATEDLLQSPSKRFDLPSLALSPRYGQDSSIANLLPISKGDKGDYSTSLSKSIPISFSMNVTALGSSNDGVSAKEIGNGLANDGEMSKPALSSEENLDPQAIVTAAEYAASIATHPANSYLSMKQNDGSSGPPLNGGLQPACVNGSLVEELRNINEANSNCHLPSQARDLAEESVEDIHTQNPELNPSPVEDLEMQKPTGNIDEKCELSSKASIEVPVVHETDCITNLCQTDLPWMLTHSDKSMFAGKPDAVVVKQEGRKMGRYSRRGKGRSKS